MRKNFTMFLISLIFVLSISAFDKPGFTKPKAFIDVRILPENIIAGEKGVIEVSFDIPEGFYQALQKEYFNFEVEKKGGFTFSDIIYPAAGIKEDIKFKGRVVLKRNFFLSKEIKPGVYDLKITAKSQLCDTSAVCYSPDTEDVLKKINILPLKNNKVYFDIIKIMNFLFFAMLGGILLNIMPCVLPVISLKVFSIIKQSADNKKSILLSSFFYSAGIIFSMVILAAAVVALKISGESIGWGFQFQNPVYVTVLLFIVFSFALSMFDVFTVNISLNISGRKNNSIYLDSFAGGIMTVLLATPCTAPFLGTALGFAFSQSPLVIFLIFIFIGIGLSLPLFILSLFPKALKFIPKSGEWMNVFKEFLGFILLLTSIWLINILYLQLGWTNILRIIIALTAAAFGFWIFGRIQKKSLKKTRGIILKICSIAVIIISVLFSITMKKSTAVGMVNNDNYQSKNKWEKFSPDKLEQYLIDKKNIFLIFSAEWCLTCKTNEKLVLRTKGINDFFIDKNITVLYGDFTSYDPAVDSVIKKYGRAGVPFYAFFKNGEREPVILPELLTNDILKKNLSAQ